MKCVSCGAAIDDDARFCSECGVRQPENQPETPPAEVETEETAAEATAVTEVVEEMTEEKTDPVEETAPEEQPEPEIISPEEPETSAEEPEPEPEEIPEPAAETEPVPEEQPEPEVAETVSDDTTVLGHMDFPDAVSEPEPAEEPEDVISVIDSVLQNDNEITPDNHIDVSEDAPAVPDKPSVAAQPVNDLPPLKRREEPAPAPMNSYSQPDNSYGQPPVNNYGYSQPPMDNYGYPQQDMTPPPPPIAPEYSDEFAGANAAPPIKVGALRLTGAAIVSFFTVIIMIAVTLLVCIKLGVTGDTIQRRMKKMDPFAVFSAEIDKDLSFSDAVYNEAGIYGISEGTIGKELFLGYICKIGALDFASGYAKDYVDYILTGKGEDPSVTNNEIVDFFLKNNDVAKTVLPYELQMADYNAIRSNFQSKDTAANFSISKWSEQAGFALENLKYIVSPVTIGIFGALLLVLLIWVIVIVDKRGKHVMGFYGTVFCWSGFVNIMCGLAVTVGASVAHVFTGMFVFYASATLLLPFALYAVAIGGAEYILGFIFKRIKRAIRIKQKRNAAVKKALSGANA